MSRHRLPLGGGAQRLKALRLDPAEIPCTIHLHQLSLHNQWGECVWIWRAGDADIASLPFEALNPETLISPPDPGDDTVPLHCTSHDPALLLRIPQDSLDALQNGGSLSLEAHWEPFPPPIAAG